jgi:hypothetical protein
MEITTTAWVVAVAAESRAAKSRQLVAFPKHLVATWEGGCTVSISA